jgi:ribosome-associated protein
MMTSQQPETLTIHTEYIELCNVLKLAGPRLTGGEAKQWIIEGRVAVEGQIETRKKCKIKPGQMIACPGYRIEVKGVGT